MKTADEQGFRDDAAKASRDNEASRRRQLREDARPSLRGDDAAGDQPIETS